MNSEIDSLDEDRILRTSEQDLCGYFVERFKVNAIEIDESNIQVDYGDADIDVSKRMEYPTYGDPGPIYAKGTKATFYIPFTGDSELFKLRPSTQTTVLPRAEVKDDELVMVYEEPPASVARIQESFTSELKTLKKYLGWVEEDLAPFNASLSSKISESLKSRRDKLLQDRELAVQTGFKLRRRKDAPATYIAPQVKRKLSPRLPPMTGEPYLPEPTLATEEYEHILSVMSNMVAVMERSPTAFINMNEEDLRQHFLVHLNGHYEGQATGETFNYEGKTDILIRVENKNIFIAECKFWSGAKELSDALDQLQSYTTWRDSKTALIVFNRDTSMTTVLNKIPQAAKSHCNFKSEMAHEFESGFRYVFRHKDDPGRDMIVSVLVFDIPN